MGATKNMVRGFLFSLVYVVTTLVIPYATFTIISSLELPAGLQLAMTESRYNTIIFWITAFGLLISGFAFFTYSSPKQSIRRGVFALFQVIINSLYIWTYKFSGAAEVILRLLDPSGELFGIVILNLQQLILVYMGIYFLTISVKVYDLIDFTVNRKTIREKRWKGEEL
ncbi:MAG: conserved membrane protein of unknown function [Promethearchaeota archaeon]|nr:MAG: conserved membrane protein of unknown function [Candidatus Lokiarchaeota archaeon]